MRLVLTIKTDNPEAEIGLYRDGKKFGGKTWLAHRELSESIHIKIEQLLKDHNSSLNDLNGILCFKGPGSFTGLRIGLTVANALAYSLKIPIVASLGKDWTQVGIDRLEAGDNDQIALPFYGAEPNITLPKK